MPLDPFVDVAALRSLGPVSYLDVRDQAAFDAGHAPGAVRVPLDEWDAAAKAADTGFAKTAYWDKALSGLGVDTKVTAVAYDSGGMTNAARVHPAILWPEGRHPEWRLACPGIGGRAAAGCCAFCGQHPGDAWLRDCRAGRPGESAGSARRSRGCVRYADARGVHR